jgi:hypothetical protein
MFDPKKNYADTPHYRNLQPLRIGGGWSVGWNTLYTDLDPEKGDVGGMVLFSASNEGRRFVIDVMFRPEFDPIGRFIIEVTYQPYLRTEKGRRRDVPFRLDVNAKVVHTFETRSYAELVEHLEQQIARCSVWVREGH